MHSSDAEAGGMPPFPKKNMMLFLYSFPSLDSGGMIYSTQVRGTSQMVLSWFFAGSCHRSWYELISLYCRAASQLYVIVLPMNSHTLFCQWFLFFPQICILLSNMCVLVLWNVNLLKYFDAFVRNFPKRDTILTLFFQVHSFLYLFVKNWAEPSPEKITE